MMDAPDFIEPSAEATLRPPGIYFGLPEDEYLADPGLGSTDARRINISPLDWWWTSSHGPEHEVVTESAAQALGTALHCYILEGEAAFEQRYLIAPEKSDDMLVTVEDLRAVLRDAGEKTSGNKSDLIDRVLDIDPKARIWDVILAAHDDECLTSNRTSINAATVQDARIRDRIIKATPEISARVTGGYPEVSIFWEANGVRWKARVDYLRTTDQTDLKSFANKNGGTIDDVITRAVASSKLHVQARLHWEGVQAAKDMLRTFGPACAHGDFDTEWLREFAKSPPGDFWWLFVQSKGAPVAAARTCPRSVKGDHSDIWQDAWWQIEAAARSFIANRDRFGMGQPWIDTAPVKRLADGDFPPWTIGQHMDFVIEEAERKAVPVMIGLYGQSGSGKTLSGLKLARGLVGPKGTVGVIDTENGRAQLYAGRDEIGPYKVITLTEPFHPHRFVDAAQALEMAGCGAIIIDSISAEWEGPGGVLDMADEIEKRSGKKGLHCWNAPKMAHRGMMQRLMRSPAHIIFCCRGKEEVIQQGKDIVRGDVIAIQERDFIYEMTLHMRLNAGSNTPTVTKCIDELRPHIDDRAPLTVETGARIAAWVNQGAEYDARVRQLHSDAIAAAQGGADALKAFFARMATDEKPLIAQYVAELRAAARSADASRPDDAPPEEMTDAQRERLADEAFGITNAALEDQKETA